MINKKLRVEEALKGRGVAIGTWARMECPEVCELIGAAGFDFVVIDTEHGSFGLEGAVEMIRAAEARGTVPVVRLPDNSPTSIKKIVDTHGQSPWHFTGQASLDLNPGPPAISHTH
jgi:4-hydroxy-2-oxoheptanedioate aldolase